MTAATEDKRFANTLARGLNVLRAFRPTDDGLGNLEISQRTGIPKPTVSRLTYTLCALGYLTHAGLRGLYKLGPAALALGNIAGASFPFVSSASPIMQVQADETQTLTGLALYDEGKMLITKTWHPAGPPTRWLSVGYRAPILQSSSGRAYVGALDEEEFELFCENLPSSLALQKDEFCVVRREVQQELMESGFTACKGDQRFNSTINVIAGAFRPPGFSGPVAFFCGVSKGEPTYQSLDLATGPALVKAIEQLKHVSGGYY